ncbi:RHS repeat domain-containing protein [Brevibacillus dissolubilis]|uniref:RHS repeat domain-containing protein n=1 Tax=Brevibacillus dissolubilis TaxID=1844116 RepID=UPI001116C1A3|nr:RHS repeat-associated core domain-containing protein [Brevibacillus dissolubilis]
MKQKSMIQGHSRSGGEKSQTRFRWKKRFAMLFHSWLASTLIFTSIPPVAFAGQESLVSDWAQQILGGDSDNTVFFGDESETDNTTATSASELENTASTSEWIFNQYPEIKDLPVNEGQPDPITQPIYTEEQILQMQWDQLSAHAVAQVNELFERRTLQIAAYFYTNLQKLLSPQETEEIYTWDDERVMREIEQLHIDQYNHLIKYTPVAGYTHKKWKKKKDNGNQTPGYPPDEPPGQDPYDPDDPPTPGEGGDPTNPGDGCGNGNGNGNGNGCGCGNNGNGNDNSHDCGCGNNGNGNANGHDCGCGNNGNGNGNGNANGHDCGCGNNGNGNGNGNANGHDCGCGNNGSGNGNGNANGHDCGCGNNGNGNGNGNGCGNDNGNGNGNGNNNGNNAAQPTPPTTIQSSKPATSSKQSSSTKPTTSSKQPSSTNPTAPSNPISKTINSGSTLYIPEITEVNTTLAAPPSTKYKGPDQHFKYFKTNTDNPVDEMYRAANVVENEISLKGRHGLDLVLTRRYHQLDSKVILPTTDGPHKNKTMTNRPELNDIPFATGWSFNIPSYDKADTTYTADIDSDSAKQVHYTQRIKDSFPHHFFHFEDGESFERVQPFDKPGYWVDEPYEGMDFKEFDMHSSNYHIKVMRDGFTYTFYPYPDDTYKLIVSKENVFGDKITYYVPDPKYGNNTEPIKIVDSVGRTILLKKGKVSFTNAQPANGDPAEVPNIITELQVFSPEGKLIKHVKYNLEYRKTSNNEPFTKLNSVEEVNVENAAQTKKLAAYTYHDPDIWGNAEFNLIKDYYLPKDDTGKILLDFNGIESKKYVEEDLSTRRTIRYLLLKNVDYSLQGLNLEYKYSHYYKGPYEQDPVSPVKNPFERGVIRLYQDPLALSYVSYAPVTQVAYSYQTMRRNSTDPSSTELKTFRKEYKLGNSSCEAKPLLPEEQPLAPEVWKVPKSYIERLAGVTKRNGDKIFSCEDFDTGFYKYRKLEKTYVINIDPKSDQGLHVLRLAKINGNTDSGLSTVTEDNYSYTQNTFISYEYEPGKPNPVRTYEFVDGIPDQEVFSFLKQPEISNRATVEPRLANYANITTTTYNEHGDKVQETDPKGNISIWQYHYGPAFNPKITYLSKKSRDGLSHEERYTYQGELISTESISDHYPKGDGNDRIERVYRYEGLFPTLPSSIQENIYGAQSKSLTQNFTYDPKGIDVIRTTMDVATSKTETKTLDMTFQYDDRGLLKEQTYPDGSKVTNTYDMLDRLTGQTFIPANGTGTPRTTCYGFDDTFNKRTMYAHLPDGRIIVTALTPFGDVEYQAEYVGTPRSPQSTCSPMPSTYLESKTMRPLVFQSYSKDGRQPVTTYPHALSDRRTTVLYHRDGTPKMGIDPRGLATYHNQTNTLTTPGSRLPVDVDEVIEPNGLVTISYQDRFGQLERIVEKEKTGSVQNTTRFTYDGFGNITQKWEKSDDQNKQRVTNFAYDNRGDLIYLQDPEKNEYNYTYDALGNLVEVIQNDQPTTRYHYNALSWKLQEDYLLDNKVERYSYTSNGDVATFTDKTGNRHRYQYSPYYELEKLTVTNKAGTTVYTEESNYDEKTRQLTNQTNGQYTLGYGYDVFNRMTSYTVSGKSLSSRTYQMSYQAVNVTDEKDQVKHINNLDDLVDSFIYPGLTAATKTSADEMTKVIYSYDQLNRLQTVSTPAGKDLLGGEVKYNYRTDSSGDLTTVSYPNGINMTQHANSLGQIQTTTHSDGWSESNTYDAFGNISRVLHSHNNKTWNYEYDKINRLVYEKNPWDSVSTTGVTSGLATAPFSAFVPTSEAVDAYANTNNFINSFPLIPLEKGDETTPEQATMLEQEAVSTSSQTNVETTGSGYLVSTAQPENLPTKNSSAEFQPAHSTITIVSVPVPKNKPKTYKYDNLGNRQQHLFGSFNLPMETRRYEYDALNRLIQANIGEKEVTYTYYPGNLRASKTVDGKTTQYIYLNGKIIEELDAKGDVTARNIWGNNLILRHDVPTNQSGYYLYNSHGDVVKVIDKDNREVFNQYEYDAWGNPSPDVQAKEKMNNPFRYAGESYDDETGFYYLRARFYDPSVGRFITEDTYKGQVDNPLSLNRYSYTANNPIRFIDPSGYAYLNADGTVNWGYYERHPEAYQRDLTELLDMYEKGKIEFDDTVAPSHLQRQFQYEVLKRNPVAGGGGRGGSGRVKMPVKSTPVKKSPGVTNKTTTQTKINFTYNNLPKDPNELIRNGWKDVTHPKMKVNTKMREYQNPETGMKVRFDPKTPGAPGYEGKDHYHIYNPKSTGNSDLYLDKNGNPTNKGSGPSHVLP